jgi:hypothetical protein
MGNNLSINEENVGSLDKNELDTLIDLCNSSINKKIEEINEIYQKKLRQQHLNKKEEENNVIEDTKKEYKENKKNHKEEFDKLKYNWNSECFEDFHKKVIHLESKYNLKGKKNKKLDEINNKYIKLKDELDNDFNKEIKIIKDNYQKKINILNKHKMSKC